MTMLARDLHEAGAGDDGHPFYPLRDHSLLLHSGLPFPSPLLLSRNYYNPAWSGLRRLKNVIVVVEWAPSVDPARLALLTDEEHAAAARLGDRQEAAVLRAHELLAFHRGDGAGGLSPAGLADAVHAATCGPADAALVAELARSFGGAGGGVSAEGLRRILVSGRLRP